jgi:hypothetical protein
MVLPEQEACTAKRLKVPVQGSPNVVLLAMIEHDDLPTHAADTAAVELAALHAAVANEPHAPVGVP